MQPGCTNSLSLTSLTEAGTCKANSILQVPQTPSLTIFAVADPAYDHDPDPRRARRSARKRRKNTKLTGELGEAAFLHAAIHRGLTVARPWGDSRRYDFIIQSAPTSNTFYRIQVKCTESPNARGYQVQSTYCDGKRKAKYTAADIDFLVGYVIPLNLFYIVPIAACPKSASLRFYPEGSERNQAKLEHFREAWHLLGK
jgi:PD-(D/E)XK endonuclease